MHLCQTFLPTELTRRRTLAALSLLLASLVNGIRLDAADVPLSDSSSATYAFERIISREVLENYLSRAVTMEGLLNGGGDLDDNIRLLKDIGARFIGRSLCLWGGEANFLSNLERARLQAPGDSPTARLNERENAASFS